MNVYECPNHNQEFATGVIADCIICKNITQRIKENEQAYANKPKTAKLGMSIYWPREKGNGGGGRVIENLAHKPIHFPTKTKLRNYLKQHKIGEAR